MLTFMYFNVISFIYVRLFYLQSDAAPPPPQEPPRPVGVQGKLGQGGRGQEGQDSVRRGHPLHGVQPTPDRPELRGDVPLLAAQAAAVGLQRRRPSLGHAPQHPFAVPPHAQRHFR